MHRYARAMRGGFSTRTQYANAAFPPRFRSETKGEVVNLTGEEKGGENH
jgi:hypothetical protein